MISYDGTNELFKNLLLNQLSDYILRNDVGSIQNKGEHNISTWLRLRKHYSVMQLLILRAVLQLPYEVW